MNIQEAFQFVKDHTVAGKIIRPYATRPAKLGSNAVCSWFEGFLYIPKSFDDDIEYGFYKACITTRFSDSVVNRNVNEINVSDIDILATDWYVEYLAGNTIVQEPL